MKKLIKESVFKVNAYEPGKPVEDLKREFEITCDICKLASNENPIGPSPLAIDAIKKSLGEGHQYPDTHCRNLKLKIAEHLQVPMENLCIGNGTTELILMMGVIFVNPGETFIMSESSFIHAKMVANIMDSHLIEVPLNNYRHDLEAILPCISENTKIVYFDNPMNPIGTMFTQEELSRFMEKIPEDVVVVFDEAYFEYVNNPSFPDTLKFVEEGRNVIVFRTFSKMYGLAGLRVGYCVAKMDFVDAFKRVSPPFSVNRFAQNAAAAALQDTEHIQKTREMNEAGKRFLYKNFEQMSVFYIPSETNFVTIDTKQDAKHVFEELQKEGVIVRDLGMYGKPTFIRVTIGTPEQNTQFIDAFKKIYSV